MFKYHCLNPIANVGLEKFSDQYVKTENLAEADGILVRSAAMHDIELPDSLVAIARAGAGVNNIPLDKCAEKGIVVFNTPGANANGVKELVIAGMLLASRDVAGGIAWVKENADDENIAKDAEKAKKNLQVQRFRARSLVLSAWEQSVSRWPMWRNTWGWKCTVTIPMCQWMQPGI